jgi:hypothetical protein
MLTSKTVRKLKAVGFSIHKAQEAFLAVLREAIEELGGVKWKKRDLPDLFRRLQEAIVGPLCKDDDGPHLSSDTFKNYMSAAQKSLLFDVPFRMAGRIKYEDLPRIKATVEADLTGRTKEEKVKSALVVMREEKRQLKRRQCSFLRVPLPSLDEGEGWIDELFGAIGTALDTPEAQSLMCHSKELRKLAKLCKAGVR